MGKKKYESLNEKDLVEAKGIVETRNHSCFFSFQHSAVSILHILWLPLCPRHHELFSTSRVPSADLLGLAWPADAFRMWRGESHKNLFASLVSTIGNDKWMLLSLKTHTNSHKPQSSFYQLFLANTSQSQAIIAIHFQLRAVHW